MSGSKESVKQQISELETILEEFEKNICLMPPISPLNENELSSYLTLNREQIEKMHPKDCASIGYVLLEYSLFVQRIINRNKAKILWGETTIKKLIANEAPNYKGSWYTQEQQAINANDVASSLQNSIIKTKMYNTRLDNVVESIQNMVKQLQNIQFSKREMSHE